MTQIITEYDAYNNILFLRTQKKYQYHESIEIGIDIILDVDKNNNIIAMEILNATETLQTTTGKLKNLSPDKTDSWLKPLKMILDKELYYRYESYEAVRNYGEQLRCFFCEKDG